MAAKLILNIGICILCFLGFIRTSTGVSLPQCRGPVRAVELREGVAGQTLICDDTGQTGSIQWTYTGLGEDFLSECYVNMSCKDAAPAFATGSRNATSSTVTFTGQATRTGHGAITVTCQRLFSNPASDTCPLDVGFPADIAGSSCSVDVIRNGNNWSLNGSCSVTKVFSSRDRYLCQWFHTPPGGGETRPVPSEQTSMTPRQATGSGDALYYSYDCSFQVSLPRSPGAHTFSLTAFPGEVTKTAGTYNIALPTTRHNCPTAVQREGSRVNCTCSIETAGSPPAQAAWNTSNNNQLSLTLGPQHNDRHYDCQARWGGDVVAHSLYSPQVAYGPSSVSVSGPRQPLDTNGQTPMTLTCDPSTSNPSPPSYQWRRLPDRADAGSQGRITVTATRDLDGKQFECTASNTRFTDISAAALFNVSLHYPPEAAPVIGGYNSGDVTYAGENLALTCTVRGGKPVASTRVIFSCPGSKQDQSDVHSQDDVTSTVTFDPLGPDDHGLNCTCTARWKNYTDWYTHQEQRTLKVYSSPSNPHINPPSTGYPFIAGVTGSARVTCVSDTRGVPPVRYTWVDTAGGQAGSDGTLTFDTVTPDLHNRTVRCRASNAFTEDKNRPLRDASRTLEIYFHPVLSLTPEGSTVSCQSTSEGTRCDVTEGDDVTITCHSRSYPAPASTLWYRGDPGGSPVSQDTVLRVTSASHVTDNGAYSCQSKTGNLSYTHPPLTSSHRLHLLVMYSTVEVNMTLNAHPANLTVSEGDHVTVTCSADGRPSPSLRLYSSDNQNDQPLASHQGGNVTLDNLVTSLDHVISPAECNHTATYRCTAGNNVMNTGSVSHNLTLYVLCRPRQMKEDPPESPTLNYKGRPVHFSVKLVAYPLPTNFTFVFHGPGNNMSEAFTDDILSSKCESSTLYSVTCNFTAQNVRAEHVGFYSALIGNSIGQTNISFEIVDREKIVVPTPPDSSPIIIGAVVGSVCFIGVVGLLVFLLVIKRRRNNDDEIVIRNDNCQRSEKADDDVMIVNDIYESSGGVGGPANSRGANIRSDYEDVAGPFPNDIEDRSEKGEKQQAVSDNIPDNDLYASVVKPKHGTKSPSGAVSTNKPSTAKKPKKAPKPQQQNKTKDAVYGNTPLSMQPVESKVYENCAFQGDEMEDSHVQPMANGDRDVEPDRLVYTTIAFSESQQKKAKNPPPEREITEYADINFARSLSSNNTN